MTKEISTELQKLSKMKKSIKEKVLDEKITTWLQPELWIEITYSQLTPDKMYREPVFLRLRLDL
jgi:ATP-dependent DNA ligase